MPAYKTLTIPSGLWPGDSYQVWAAEQPAPGSGNSSASERVALGDAAGRVDGFTVTGFFSAAPGVFEIDVQVSDVDVDAQYQTIDIGVINVVDATNNSFNLQAPGYAANFVRLLMRTRTNAVNVTADIRKS